MLVTKYIKKVINAEILQRLKAIIRDLCAKWGCDVVEFNRESDHIRLLFDYYPQMQRAQIYQQFY